MGRLRQRWGRSATEGAVVLPSGCVVAAGRRAADDFSVGCCFTTSAGWGEVGGRVVSHSQAGSWNWRVKPEDAHAPAANHAAPLSGNRGWVVCRGRPEAGRRLDLSERGAGGRPPCRLCRSESSWRIPRDGVTRGAGIIHSIGGLAASCGLSDLSAPSTLAPAARGRPEREIHVSRLRFPLETEPAPPSARPRETDDQQEEVPRDPARAEGLAEGLAQRAAARPGRHAVPQAARALELLRSDRELGASVATAAPRPALGFKWWNRRSQRRSFTWAEFAEAWERWKMPRPRIVETPLPWSWREARQAGRA
ncbi:hypothetical protein Hsar01_01221 [Haloferula sargassicola]|uniref:Uncharacterized protein n=1 Tax=Haloferula sargassicola TaxID=490096 RepID=A0ABP9UK58_9BACT